ncbi:MAG: hypothetical protein EHM21_05620 [Chloroflexi bacterium]|nr:MAG: hypothetical protein EHM21_05620 [Chloroflexota bacterium]
MEKLKEAARQNYQAVRKMAIGFLKEKITTPQPPAIPLRCTADKKVKQDRENQLQIFLAEFAAPEEAIARYVLEAGRSDAFLNDQNDSIELAAKIAGRLVKKAVTLIKAYYPQEEYYLPVMQAAISADRQYQLLGGSEEGQNILEKAAEWARKIADQYLKALREQHDYQLIHTLIGMDREASLLGKSRENIFAEIKKALKFKVQFDLQAATDVEYGHVSWTTQGKAGYSYFDSGDKSYRSMGKGAYTDFQWPVLEDMPPVIMTSPPDFDFEVIIQNFDACETNSFDILINRFAADVETYASGGMEVPLVSGNGLVSAITWAAFEDKIIEAPEGREGYPWYRFTIPLQNLNEVAGEINMPREVPYNTANLKITLIHAPEK